MFDWDKMRKDKARAVASARATQPGLPREQLVPGALVTVSPCLCTSDRSYSHDVFEVVAMNGGHVLLRYQDRSKERGHFRGPHLLAVHEHEFYPAEHLITAQEERAAYALATADDCPDAEA
jgi:hypothetical protein